MRTRRQARLRSSSMPPSPVASRPISGDRTADAIPDQNGPEDLSVREEYPFQVFHEDVAQLADAEQRNDAPGQSNLGVAADTSASVARDVIGDNDTGYITPTKNVARSNSSHRTHVSAIQSNEQIFPQWFAEQGNSTPTTTRKTTKFVWSNSSPEDELGEVPFIKTEPADTPNLETPHENGPSELSKLFRGTAEDKILADRMNKVHDLQDASGSEDSDVLADGHSHVPDSDSSSRSQKGARSIYGHYKRPRRPGHSESGSDSGKSEIPYLKKGKWKAFSSERSVTQERQDQINADHLLALALEREENQRLRAQLVDAEARGRVEHGP